MTGDPTEYGDDDAQDIYEALLDAMGDDIPGGTGTLTITGRIEWQGDFHRGNNGMRTVNLSGVELGPIVSAVDAAKAAQEAAGAARVLNSYRAKSPTAQARGLMRTARGRAAAERAGLSVSPRTLKAWLSGQRQPSKANREKIANAYNDARTAPVRNASDAARAAIKNVADSVSDAIKGSTSANGIDVRIFDVRNIDVTPDE